MRDAEATESTSEAKYNEVRQDERSLHKGHITLLPGEKQPRHPTRSRRERDCPRRPRPTRMPREPRPTRRRQRSTPAPQAAPPPTPQSTPLPPTTGAPQDPPNP